MPKKQKELRILFNASVVLAGLNSPVGGSGTLLRLVKSKEITGNISELILDEVVRHADKIGRTSDEAEIGIREIFKYVNVAPSEKMVEKYQKLTFDPGDAHILASCREEGCDVLVTLDKKHLLILQGKVKGLQILTPGQFLNKFYPVETKRKS